METVIEKVRTAPFPVYNPIGEEEARAAAAVVRTGLLSDYVGRHGDKFAGGEVVRVREKAAGENLQRQVPGPGREMKSIKENRCAFPAVLGKRARKIDVQQLQSGRHIDRRKITKSKRGALYHERREIERRRTRDASKGVGVAVGGDQRVVGQRH